MSTQKIALVTGGNRGIGLAVVRGLAGRGMTVLQGSRSPAPPRANIRPVTLDVTSDQQVDALAQLIDADYGRLDVLVNNAGVALSHLPRPSEETVDGLRHVYEVNVFGVVRMVHAMLPLLLRADAPRVVNVTSRRGSLGDPGAWVGRPSMSYSSSKTALNALTVHYAREFAGTALKINGAAPGHVATDFNGFRGTRTPEEGAEVVLRLATLDASRPTGEVYEDDTRLMW